MAYNFPYLKDKAFLKKFDKLHMKQRFVKIIVLDFEENPIQEIQGKVTGGSFSLDGSSAVRRTGSVNLITDEYKNNLTTIKSLLSINKKVQILIGFKNTTDEYTDYKMIWFPMGIYIIISPNISHDANGVSISLTLHDKMALLNGECGGTLPASVVFSQIEDIDLETGEKIIIQPIIYQIIQELVHHFGGEQLGKIIISDIDSRIKQVLKWNGSAPLYFYQAPAAYGSTYNHFDTNYAEVQSRQDQYGGTIKSIYYGDDVGYILTDFVYPGELIANANATIVSVLDQIKNILGNYEYFYDINGNFRFQQIKNYLNTSYSTFEIDQITPTNYLVDYAGGKSVYEFEDGDIILSYSNAPQYQMIKNDFVVWGKRTSAQGIDIPIRYHLAIDKKPETGNQYKVFFYIDEEDGIKKAKRPLEFSSTSAFPLKGQVGFYYLAANTSNIYLWNGETQEYDLTSYTIETITTNDYRTELYMNGVWAQPYGLDSNYYYTELKNEWPKLYNMEGSAPDFKDEVIKQPEDIDFFLDFIDTDEALAEFSVNNIGRRTLVINDNTINCIFAPDIPDLVVIESGTVDTTSIRQECEDKGQNYVLIRSEIFNMFLISSSFKSAYEEIRKELYQYTDYNEQVNITTLPIYYLEPNTRITIRDPESGIDGDFMIRNISVPLEVSGTMNISCTKALERI